MTTEVSTWNGLVTLRAITGSMRTREHYLQRNLNSRGMTKTFVPNKDAAFHLIQRLRKQGFIVESYVNNGATDINAYLLSDAGTTLHPYKVLDGFVNLGVPASGDTKAAMNILFADITETDDVYNFVKDELLLGCEDVEKIKFNLVYGYSNDGSTLMDTRTFERDWQVPVESFYPYIEGGYVKLINDFLDARSNLMVFIGKPGTGKSTLLRQVVAKAAGTRKVFQFTGEKVICHSAFDAAIASLPENALVIIEDADSITGRRADGNASLSSLLNEIDGISNKGIKFIITTNLPTLKDVDEALLRPGRLFKHIYFRCLNEAEAKVLVEEVGSVANSQVIGKSKEYSIADLMSDGEGYLKQSVGFL